MADTPNFWWQKHNIIGYILAPLGMLYGRASAKNMLRPPHKFADVPVLCIGNFIVGGAGKTPTALAFARAAKRMGKTPGFLSRGYGGAILEATMVDRELHNSSDVGDEPLILAKHAPTAISVKRYEGAQLLVEAGVDFIIMDDGFQNPGLHKDFKLVVVNSRRGVGNGFAMPAGPLRASLSVQMRHLDALLMVGDDAGGENVVRRAAKAGKPFYSAKIHVINKRLWTRKKVLAFAGIADPAKFYKSLEEAGVEIVERRSFHDHHAFQEDEIKEILDVAQQKGLMIVTTEKDYMRLIHRTGINKELADQCKVLNVEMRFDDPSMLESVINKTIAAHKAQRLRTKTA